MKTYLTTPARRSSSSMLKLAALLLVTLASSLLTSCNTTAGAGRDIKHAGSKIEQAADSAR